MPPIAVIGIGALFPGGVGKDSFWRTILSGRDCMEDVPPSHWLIDEYYDPDPAAPGKTYARRGAFLSPVTFDPVEHGIPPNLVPSTDTAQLLALIAAGRVLEDSGALAHVAKDRISVILGVASATELVSTMSGSLQRPVIAQALRESGIGDQEIDAICDRFAKKYVDWTESTFPGLLGNVVAGRIANRFDLGGTNCVIDAACASSLAALKVAVEELWTGSADMVITGGVDAINDIFMYMCFSKTLAMSRTGDCRPFSDEADGTMLGEGIGLFALRRLADAERDGDRIYAVLRGVGSSSDGRAKSIYAPRAEGQVKALRRAYELAGYEPFTVELMEAHGTGTVAGDAAEIAALKEVFSSPRDDRKARCALGSIKSQIGHTKAAAGAASLYKAVMALHHKVLPPTIKVRQPNPALGLESSPFYLNTEARPWIRSAEHPRRASVSSFGFGGSNFHLTLEEYSGAARPPRMRMLETELFLFSAADREPLLASARAAPRESVSDFAAAARNTQTHFSSDALHRLAIVASDSDDLASKLDRGLEKPVDGVLYTHGPKVAGQVAFLFPGQGSQYVGMGSGLVMAFPDIRRIWDEAAHIVTGDGGERLADLVFPPPAFSSEERTAQTARLTSTKSAQLAIGITSAIYLKLITQCGIRPDMTVGHSFGEVTALFSAGVLSEEGFHTVSLQRGELMARAAARLPGAMLAVGAPVSKVRELLPELGPDIVIANVNSPRQVVLAGPVEQIKAAATKVSTHKLSATMFPVATAFHSPIVEPAAIPFTEYLNGVEFRAPLIPVFANTTAQPYPGDAEEMRALLGSQLARPVRFADQVDALYEAGARIFIEVGPGSVLTSFASTCLEGREHLAVAMDAKGKNSVTGLWIALGKLAVAGISVNLSFAWEEFAEPARDVKSSPAAIAISGTNFGKKYPSADAPDPRVRPPTSVVDVRRGIEGGEDRFATIRMVQEKMSEAHAAAQRAMAESHITFLKMSEVALTQLMPGSDVRPVYDRPIYSDSEEQPSVSDTIKPQVIDRRDKEEPPRKGVDELVLEIVAEQTGYPRHILTPDMDLEADLGIDSIKRVQILAAIEEFRPELATVEASEMAGLRTIRSVVTHLTRISSAIPAAAALASMKRIGLEEVPAPTAQRKLEVRTGTKFAIVGCTDGIGVALARRLSGQGFEASVSIEIPDDAHGVVFLDFEDRGNEGIDEHACRIFSTAKSFISRPGANEGALILVGPRDAGWRSGHCGFARTVALEHPKYDVRTIEVEKGDHSPNGLADLIAHEILHSDGADHLIIDASGRRAVLQEIEQPLYGNPDSSLLEGSPVIVATGGARGVTAACLIAVAEKYPIRVALIGRTVLTPEPDAVSGGEGQAEIQAALFAAARKRGETPAPQELSGSAKRILANREIARTVDRLRSLGSEAIYVSADVSEMTSMEQSIADVRRRWGHVDGLIHAAGVLADKRIVEKSAEQFLEVYRPKVLGLRTLLALTQDDPLRFIFLFSSVAGRYGNAGQADYAMANSVLNQIAKGEAARRGSACVVRALNWGPWDGGMVTAELKKHFAARGVPIIPIHEGAAAFVRELHHRNRVPADANVVLAVRA